jgi:hypothetical protein
VRHLSPCPQEWEVSITVSWVGRTRDESNLGPTGKFLGTRTKANDALGYRP